MRQVFVIHGGDTFVTRDEFLNHLRHARVELNTAEHPDWKRAMRAELGSGFEVVLPQMPNKQNAHYDEWALWFERHLPLLADGTVLVGHSLGAIFLAKYLSEQTIPFVPSAVFLLSAPYEAADLAEFKLPSSLAGVAKQGSKIFLYHSKDDPIVSFDELAKYQAALPNATVRIFENRGHFYGQESFPELVADIKAL